MALAQRGDDVHKETYTIESNTKKIIVNQQYEKFIFYAYPHNTPPTNYANVVTFFYDGSTTTRAVTNKYGSTAWVDITRWCKVENGTISASSYDAVFMTIGDWTVIQIPID